MWKLHEFSKSYTENNAKNDHIVHEKYNGRIGLMCPDCFSYWIVDFNQDCTMSINKDIFYGDNPEEYEGFESGCDVDPTNELTFSNMFRCPECSSKESLIMLDPNITTVISLLNKKGFRTSFSCEGHKIADSDSYAYILFNNLSKKNQDILTEAFKNSSYWVTYNPDFLLPYLDKSQFKYYNNNFMLDSMEKCKDSKEENLKENYLHELLDIVMGLPYLDKSEIIKNNYEYTAKDYIRSLEGVLATFKDKVNHDYMIKVTKQVCNDILEMNLT